MADLDVVIVRSKTEEGAQALLDRVCRRADLRPVSPPEQMLGRTDRWVAQAVPAEDPTPPASTPRPLGERLRRGHR